MSTVEEQLSETVGDDVWSEEFARTLQAHRERARQLLDSERERIARVEATLNQQLQVLATELSEDRAQATWRDADISTRSAQLDERAQELDRWRAELASREAAWQKQQVELNAQQQQYLAELRDEHKQLAARRDETEAALAELARQSAAQLTTEENLRRRENELAARLQQFDELTARLTQSQQKADASFAAVQAELAALEAKKLELASAQQQLTQDRLEVETREQESASQRRRIARELRAQRSEMLAEVERRQAAMLQIATGEESQLRAQLSAQATQADDLRRELLERDSRSQEQHDQLTAARNQAEHIQALQQARDEEIKSLRRQLAEREAGAALLDQGRAEMAATIARLQEELASQRQAHQHELTKSEQASAALARLTSELEETKHAAARQLAAAQATNNLALDEQVRSLNEQLATAAAEQAAEQENSRRIAAELTARQSELERLKAHAEQQAAELVQLQAAAQDGSANAAEFAAERATHQAELDRVKAELSSVQKQQQKLLGQLADAEKRLADQPAGDDAALNDLQRRYDMSCSDLKQLKSKNGELMQEVAKLKAQCATAGAGHADNGAMDWESQKRRMLEQLDDFDEKDANQHKEKLTIAEAIRTTSKALEEREVEIEELKKLLDQQASNLGNVAVGAAAIADMLNQDELITQEREALSRLQAEWREKLKKAEVDISLERAKLARQRNEFEEKIQQLEAAQSQSISTVASSGANDSDKKPQRGRWLARLGLKEDEQGKR